jgi:phosphoglycolate phosphatase
MAKDVAHIPLFPDIDKLLQSLSQNRQMIAVVSSNSLENIQAVLGPELAGLVRYYECGTSLFGKSKKLKNILKRSTVWPERVIYIGDESRDISAAREAGIQSGAVCWGYAESELLKAHAPAELFTDVDEMIRQLNL